MIDLQLPLKYLMRDLPVPALSHFAKNFVTTATTIS